jgi:hypothetical protein
MKNPLTPAGIEPETFRFVAQHLNYCANSVPASLNGRQSKFSGTPRELMFALTSRLCELSGYRCGLDHVTQSMLVVVRRLSVQTFKGQLVLEDGTDRMSGQVGKSCKVTKNAA